MKRDMNLIREILVEIEDAYNGRNRVQIHSVEGHSGIKVAYHVRLLVDAGYVNAGTINTSDGTTHLIRGITWEGHEFLDAVRSENVWRRVQKKLKEIGGQASMITVKQLAIEAAKDVL
ncbi:MAG: DUF2513 domain-containing protein [Bryobacterales bacterium]|nr:DUF2513 domain-containing protein [Bryobacterales bacterium]